MGRISTIILCVSLILSINSYGQPLQFEHLSIEEGLTQSDVTSIIQDNDGFMWFATNNGLNKYDGYSIRKLKQTDGLINNVILSLEVDGQNNIWIGSKGGICSYNTTLNEISQYTINLPNTDSSRRLFVSSICATADSTIYITINKTLFSKRHDETEFNDTNFSSDFVIRDILSCNGGSDLLISTYNGVFRYYPRSKKSESIVPGNIRSICYGIDKNIVYLANDSAIFRYNIQERSLTDIDIANGDLDNINNIYCDSDGHLWIGTLTNGLFRYGNNQLKEAKHIYADNRSLSSNHILSIYEDRSKTLWVGTSNGGVNKHIKPSPYFHTIRYDNIDYTKGLSDNVVQSIITEGDSIVWISTKGGYLNKWDRTTKYVDQYNVSNGVKINAISHSPDSDEIFVAAGNRLYTFNKTDHKLSPIRTTNSQHSVYKNTMFLDFDSTLWCATGNGIFAIKDRQEVSSMPSIDPDSGLANNCRIVYRKDKYSPLYAGFQYMGLREIELQNGLIVTKPVIPDTLKMYPEVAHIYQDNSDRLWIGTWGGGFYMWDGVNLENYTEKDGLSDNIVFAIYEDNSGYLWISTYNGLSRFNSTTNEFRNFSYYDGLQSNEFSFGANIQNANDEIMLGGINGLTYFHPESIQEKDISYPVIITGMSIFNKSVLPNKEIEGKVLIDKSISECEKISLPHNFNTISLSVALLSYQTPQRNQFKFKLKGYQDKWTTQVGNSHIVYTKVPPGRYEFIVYGSTYNGVWGDNARALEIEIRPPFYQSQLAYIIYLILFILLVGLLTFKINRTLSRKIAKKGIKEMYEARMQFYTGISHDLRTPLTLIIGLIETLQSQDQSTDNKTRLNVMKRNANILLRLINEIIDFRKIETGNMYINSQRCDIALHCRTIFANFKEYANSQQIDMHYRSSDNTLLAYLDINKCENIIYNILSNALKFTKTSVEMRLDTCDYDGVPSIRITIEDDGIGISAKDQKRIFERFYRVSKSSSQGSGIGLHVSIELAQLMGGDISVDSQVDRYTKFTLRLPIGIDHDAKSGTINDEIIASPKDNMILVIDDNEDLRYCLRDSLQDIYDIHEASCGEEGLEAAQRLLPDLIICDIMMPGIDGIEVCRKIKQNPNTALTPFILISARTSDQYKVDGLSYGADAYFTKPFSLSYIKAQIESIIQNRTAIKERLSLELLTKPQSIDSDCKQNEWLVKLMSLMEDNISNAEYDIERLSADLAMSRMQVYRKFKSTIGQTPGDFIRDFRLTRAAELIDKTDMSISEVCYAVGYNDVKYFRSIFIKKHGMLPSKYTTNAGDESSI